MPGLRAYAPDFGTYSLFTFAQFLFRFVKLISIYPRATRRRTFARLVEVPGLLMCLLLRGPASQVLLTIIVLRPGRLNLWAPSCAG